MKRFIALGLLLVMVLSLASCGGEKTSVESKSETKPEASKEVQELKFSISGPVTSNWNVGAEKFGEILSAKTDGRFKVKVFANDELSGGNQVTGIELVQSGATDVHIQDALVWSSIAEKVILPCMPWLLPSYEDVDKYMEGEGGQALMDVLSDSGVVCLALGENGYRQAVNTKRAINVPADMKGLKMRIPGSNVHVSILKHLGADPITMNQSEVYTSLQQGAIDACENTLDLLVTQNTLEVVNHLTLWNYSYDPLFLTVSQKLWNSLSEEDKVIFKEAAVEAMKEQKKVCREGVSTLMGQIKEKYPNVSIVETLSPEALAQFKEAVHPVYTEFKDKIGADLFEKFGYKFD